MLKSLQFLIAITMVFCFFSCGEKSEAPMLEIRLEIEPNPEWDFMQFIIPEIYLIDSIDTSSIKTSTIENVQDDLVSFDLRNGFAKSIFFDEISESEVDKIGLSLKRFSLSNPTDGFTQVHVLNDERTFSLNEPIIVEEDHLYLIDIKLDIDKLDMSNPEQITWSANYEITMLKN